MKKTKLFMLTIVVFSLAFVYNCKNEDTTGVGGGGGVKPLIIPAGTNIPFRDDFNGGTRPNSFWTLCWPELTNDNDPTWNRFFKNTKDYECVKVENSHLKLTAKKGTGSWTNIDKKTGGVLHYKTGGVWSSQNKYGIGTSIKVKAKLVKKGQQNFNVKSAFPAIWYYPLFTYERWPLSGEIDIMEWSSQNNGKFHSTIHCSNENQAKPNLTKSTNLDSANWHEYRCDWYSNNVVIYYDGQEFYRYTKKDGIPYPFNDHYYNIILNASLGKGGWIPNVEDYDEDLPYEMWVDWVEVSLIDKGTGQPITNK